jgi:uncharacterized protein with von Willebrand factor type A (vWA) domain
MQHDFILLDRSESMESLWDEALGSVNAYVEKLAADNVDTGVTIAVFDSQSFDVIRERIIPKTMSKITSADASPRAGTPLSDAIGKIVALADKGGYDRVAIIVMTDGHENASRELSVADAKKMLDRCRAKGWQVIFLGADFDNASQAKSYGISTMATAEVAKGKLRESTVALATMRTGYAATGAAMEFTSRVKADLASKS